MTYPKESAERKRIRRIELNVNKTKSNVQKLNRKGRIVSHL